MLDRKALAPEMNNLSSVEFSRSVPSDSLQPPGWQHSRLPCPSPAPRACSNSCPLTQWCHPIKALGLSLIPQQLLAAVVQSLSRWLFATPWTAAHLASLSFTISWSLLKLMSIESVMPPNHLILLSPSPPQQLLNYINYYFSFSLSRLTRCFALGWRLAGGRWKLIRQCLSSPTFPSL